MRFATETLRHRDFGVVLVFVKRVDSKFEFNFCVVITNKKLRLINVAILCVIESLGISLRLCASVADILISSYKKVKVL